MKRALKKIISSIDVSQFQRMEVHSILGGAFQALGSVPCFEDRDKIWEDAFEKHITATEPITYIEFGVFKGASIRKAAEKNRNGRSRFFGLDSFEGLPTNWADLPKGAFSTNGEMPKIDDSRVKFVKGWFQDSWDCLWSQLQEQPIENLVVHFDADLYSSTLFALTKIDMLKCNYVAVFDEFTGDETRALYDFLQAYDVSVEFYSKTLWSGYPFQVACKISRPGNAR